MFYDNEKSFKNMNDLKTAICAYIEYWNNYIIVTRLKMSPYQYKNSLHNVRFNI